MKQNKLITTAELYEDNLELAFKNDQFNALANMQPKKEWVRINKYANNSPYMPIGIVETLMQKVFKKFKVEVLNTSTMFNAVCVTVRVHYWNGVDDTWSFHDGVGAMQIQTKSGASPADLQSINNNAVMMALPAAKSYAIKDACEHIGALFGRDLSRKDVLVFETDKSIDAVNDRKEMQRITDFIADAKTPELLITVYDAVQHYGLVKIYDAKLSELKGGQNGK